MPPAGGIFTFMSNVLFPKIRGLAWSVTKTPTFSTEIQESVAGREVRVQNFQNPIWEFTLSYEYLLNDPKSRDENEQTPLETLVGFFLTRGGQFDDFLLNESDLTGRLEDSVYSGQPIAIGDGTSKSFQLSNVLLCNVTSAWQCFSVSGDDRDAGFGLYDSWFAVDPAGSARYLGSGMWMVDAGDYHADKKSELVFSIDQENRGGYRIYYDNFKKTAEFKFSYH